MSQQSTIGKTATRIEIHQCGYNNPNDQTVTVWYHATPVVTFDRLANGTINLIRLDTGGYFTNTTKTRMNQTSAQFNLGFKVYQHNYQWHAILPTGEHFPFKDTWMAFSGPTA